MSSLFGGQKSKTTDATSMELQGLRPEYARMMDKLLSGGGANSNNPLSGIPQFSGPLAAPMAAGEQVALGQVASAANDPMRQGLLADTMSGKFTDPNANPFLQAYTKAAQDETARRYEEILGRTLPGQFAQAGHRTQAGGSSPFDRAAAIQSEGFARELGNIATNIGFNAYEQERGRQQQSIQLSQQEVDTNIRNLQAQALPRMIQQYGLDAGLKQFQERTQSLLQLLSMLSGGTLSQQGQTSRTNPDMISPFITAAGTGVLAGSMGGGQ